MAAYAAVISLKHTIHGLLHHSPISLASSTTQILECAYDHTEFLQQVLERSNDSSRSSFKRLDSLEGQIRDCANNLEGVLESHELNSQDQQVRKALTSFADTVKEMAKEYDEELSRDNEDEDDHDDDDLAIVPSSDIDFGVEMVGHSENLMKMKRHLLCGRRPDELWFYALYGNEGSGRATVANTFFQDARTGTAQDLFDCSAWVAIGKTHELKQVLKSIITQVQDQIPENELFMSTDQAEDEEYLRKYLYKILEHRRYMLVLDDVEDVELVNYLRRSLPADQSKGSIVFLTTASYQVTQLADRTQYFVYPERYYSESIRAVMQGVFFGDAAIPEQLQVAVKEMIDNCGGLFVSAMKTIIFLLKSGKTLEEWSKIAADYQYSVCWLLERPGQVDTIHSVQDWINIAKHNQNSIFRVVNELSEISELKRDMQCYSGPIVEMISLVISFPHEVEVIKMKLNPERFFSRTQIISFYGMAGIGKSAIAREVLKDESISSHFDHQVWITLGKKYLPEEILIDILAQIYPSVHALHMKEDEKLVKDLCAQVSGKRCLIVLDDLCSQEPLHHLKKLFPNISAIIWVTTRLSKVAKFGRDDFTHEMQLLGEEESWRLLYQKVFAGGSCPHKLEKAGRKIAEMCDGLPLLILTVADQLLRVEISQQYWNDVANGKEKSVFKNAHRQISKAILPSYRSLPQHLKPCFLYMGVFREKYEISVSDLTALWISEGFLEPNSSHTDEDLVAECFSELVDTSIVLVERKISNLKVTTCRLHSIYWHLCNSEAAKNKFIHAINNYKDCMMESMVSQRRLCIRNSSLLGMVDVQTSMASNTCAHSFLCVNPLNQYPVPINFNMRLLRVMNAVTIRLYDFPIEVVELVHLRYLGLTCNGDLPSSISNLWKLQHLIVKRYMNIKSSESSMLPEEIWDMEELKHLQVMGGCLPDPKCGTSGLLKLSALLDVSVESCRKDVLKCIPNLKRLGILIELAPDDEGECFHYLNNIYVLSRLESLKCVVVNPQIGEEFIAPPAPVTMFPPSLKRVSLSGLGYPWEYMTILGKLKNLQVLKLKHYAFQGPKWRTQCKFEKLRFLLIEDADLVDWIVDWGFAGNLEHLYIKHCYKLRELTMALYTRSLVKVEMVDCDPFTMDWEEQMRQMRGTTQYCFHGSWLAHK